MGKLDVSGIEGFDAMSAEQKVEALMGLDVPDAVDMSGYIDKKKFDKLSSELADAKRKLNETQANGANEKSESERAIAELQEKYDALMKESTIDKYTAQYKAMQGFDDKLARATAEALFAGDMKTVFDNQKKANEAYAKQLKADAMKNMTPPAGGSGEEQPESDAIRLAKELGQKKAQAAKTSDDIMKQFMRGGRLS